MVSHSTRSIAIRTYSPHNVSDLKISQADIVYSRTDLLLLVQIHYYTRLRLVFQSDLVSDESLAIVDKQGDQILVPSHQVRL